MRIKWIVLPALLLALLTACGTTEVDPNDHILVVPEVAEGELPEAYSAETQLLAADGRLLEADAIHVDDVLCVEAEALAELLQAQWTWGEDGGILQWQGQQARVQADSTTLYYGGREQTLAAPVTRVGTQVFLPVESCCRILEVPTAFNEQLQALQLGSDLVLEPVCLVADGVPFDGGAGLLEEVLFVDLDSLAEALQAEWSWNGTDGTLQWQEKEVALADNTVTLLQEEDSTALPAGLRELYGQVLVEAEPLLQLLELNYLYDKAPGNLYLSTIPLHPVIPEGVQVPVLMYHGVSDEPWGGTDLFVRPAVLEESLQYLQDNGFTPIWFEDLARVDEIEKPVLLTFDDGYRDNYDNLFPLLQKYNMKATIFVVTGNVDVNENFLTSAQVREMADSGLVSIQSHTVDHYYLSRLSQEDQDWQLGGSRIQVARLTGRLPYAICYPVGDSNEATRELAKQYYGFGINMNGGLYVTGQDPYQISRYYISRQDGVQTFINWITVG